MSKKTIRLLAGMAIICLLISPALVVADTAGGTGPDDALAPSGEWTPLDRGQEHWYAFEYSGHQEMQASEEDEDEEEAVWVSSRIQILLDAEPDGSIGFSVWTPENIRAWVSGEDPAPIGRGGEDENAPGDLCWCGTFHEVGTYYVVVERTDQGPETAYYTLDIRGSDISFTAPMAAPAVAAEPAGEAEEVGMDEVAAEAGTGPDNAAAPSDEWVYISDGESLWYAFDYFGHHEFELDEDDEEVAIWVASPVQISLDSQPDEAVGFSVWNEEQVRLWSLGEEVDPLGRGTENENEAGDLFWAGSLGNPGRYYVVVETQGTEPGTFVLSISGEDVSP